MPNDGGLAGTQPIRVLDFRVLEWFERKYPGFRGELEGIGKQFGLTKTIRYVCDELPILGAQVRSMTPFVNGAGQITIHETFLSYIWALGYAFLVIFDEEIHGPHIGKQPEHSKPLGYFLPKGHAALYYALSLITEFNKWPPDLPSPEAFKSEDRYYVERANAVYVAAVDFILCHELGHIARGHLKKLKQAQSRGERIKPRNRKKFEREADGWALAHIVKGIRPPNRSSATVGFGALAGLGSLLFLNCNLTSPTHPDKDERIRNILLGLPLHERDSLWGIAAAFYVAWDKRFAAGLDLSGEYETYFSLVRRIESQLTSRKRRRQKKGHGKIGLD